jgi:hypothetical protein
MFAICAIFKGLLFIDGDPMLGELPFASLFRERDE